MSSKTEQILVALLSALRGIPDATVERNSAVPEKIPTGGLIILRDGTADEPERRDLLPTGRGDRDLRRKR